jgi:Mat/Ecp fimbriae major subunit
MMKSIAYASAFAALLAAASPAAAVSPASQATANAKIYKPLTISKVQNLDFGVIVLGAGTWSGEVVSITQAGALTCGGGTNLTCSGSVQPAKYHLVGTNNAMVTVSSPGFNLTGPGTLAFTPNAPATVNLGATGSTTGVDFSIGGSITLASTTPDGVYSGTFAVTADYQ